MHDSFAQQQNLVIRRFQPLNYHFKTNDTEGYNNIWLVERKALPVLPLPRISIIKQSPQVMQFREKTNLKNDLFLCPAQRHQKRKDLYNLEI